MNAATPTISTDVAAASRVVDAPAEVVELARTAARQDAGEAGLVGSFVDAVSEDDVALTLRFATTEVAYTGWTWCVTVALVDPAQPTISEVVLLPGPDSLLPPPWLPWSERIRPGDLGPGDLLLAPTEDDPRLAPAYVESDDPAVEDVAHELGIGRVRVMSRGGRTDTADRWHDSAFGPTADMAKQAPLHCVMCAFFLPLAGSLGARFGACGNEMSPADGRVVDMGYGCGAHSENVIEPVPTGFRPSHIDDTVLDVHPRAAVGGFADGAAAFLGEDDSELEVGPTHVVGAETAPDVEVPGATADAADSGGDTDQGAVANAGGEAEDVTVQLPLIETPAVAADVDVATTDVEVPVATDEPVVDEPVADDVVADDVVADDVVADDVVADDVVADDVSADDVAAQDVAIDEPVVDAPVAAGEPAIDGLPVDELPADELPADEPATDELPADEPATDELPADDPAAEAPAVDHPGVDDLPAAGGPTDGAELGAESAGFTGDAADPEPAPGDADR